MIARHIARFGSFTKILFVNATQKPFHFLFVLGSEFLFGESIAGGLELGDVVILGDDFQLVERAAKENSLSHHAANTYRSGRNEPDFLASAR